MNNREVAVALIVAEDGRLLLQLRDDAPGRAAPGRWGFVGGRVEPGERPADALLRELREELGWRPRHFEPYVTRAIERADEPTWRGFTSHVFAAHLDVAPDALVLGEGQALALFPPQALPGGMVPGIAPLIGEFAASAVYARIRRSYAKIFTAGLLVDGDGRLLLQHRDDKAWIINPGKWSTFGGHLEAYETPQDGFLREMQEELAWRPHASELFYACLCACAGPEHLVYDFAAAVDVPHAALQLREGQGMAFFAPDALPAGIVPQTGAEIARFVASPRYAALVARARSG
ncbi:MAG: NUDIX domain-containing protein [Dehalococcoidia bacterium]|nr:NUDIX domain-containing protein [Dehalococcoidia bacterium]